MILTVMGALFCAMTVEVAVAKTQPATASTRENLKVVFMRVLLETQFLR